ncbi:NCS1 nucleoside transporter [Colletotrichum navitas]|uniref:NCS1 nucleoside transporter n=1 Tax=Colletotrichum navitas TaxID=681940 RepID=A0AAD8Q8S3_9PEZI|nr:NCS1 nucleoside transporter [Colletotrichum navitas]KAK1596669.1 NCS1 nucleoside transporter [Colletotrichum navitas]
MGLRKRLELRSENAELGTEGGRLSNKDMDPIPMGSPERTWGWPSLLGFWIAEAFSISMYQVSSTSVTKGLNPGLAILAVFIGHVLVCIPAILDGYVGCILGINFPVFTRASFGIRGSYAAVFVRGVVACIWFGTQSFQGGQCLQVMISAIWPQFNRFPNHLSADAHVTSSELLCFFLFVIVQLPLLWLHVSSLRYMFMVKTVIMPIFGLALFIWAIVAGKGFGPTFSKPTIIKDGTPAAVVFFQCVTSAIGPKATLALNMPDFTRYAKDPKQVFWTQAVGLCILVTMCGVLGATVSSASEVIYGKVTWNPLEVAVLWDNRAAQFFAGLCWAFAVIGTNISANSVSFSNDLSLWFPKYINNRRGAYICAVFGVCAVPWYIQYSAKSFSSFLGGYALFLGAIAGVIVTDFWICRGRKVAVSSLYDPRGIHYYTFGVNPRAVIAFIFGIIPNMPGLAAACGARGIPKGALYLYSLSWLVSTVVAGFTYWLCWKIVPFPVDDRQEQLYVDGLPETEESIGSEKGVETKEPNVKPI